MITSLIEMLELPNFGQMTTSTMYFDSLDTIFLLRHGQKLWGYNLFFKIK